MFVVLFISVPSLASCGSGQSSNIAGFYPPTPLSMYYFLLFSLRTCYSSLFVAAYASRARETKSPPSEINSRASSWLPSLNQWTRWRWRRVRVYLYYWQRSFIGCTFELIFYVRGTHLLMMYFFRNVLGQLAGAVPQSVTVTPEEREAIERVSYSSSLLNLTLNDTLWFPYMNNLNLCRLDWNTTIFFLWNWLNTQWLQSVSDLSFVHVNRNCIVLVETF